MVGTSSCLMRLPNLNLTKCETSPLRVYARTLASKPSFPYLRCASPQSSEVILAPSDTLTEVSQSSSVDSKFHPSVWDSHFVDSSSSDSRKPETFSEERINELKKEVKTMLSLASNDPFTELELIDNIQRLGVAYHFETQIEDAIQRIYDNDTHFFDKIVDYQRSDLCATSLWFRLLRQAGYHVSPDVFQKFKDEKGEFHASLASDLQGMLSLYEASYLSFNGEDIMDEAMAFTTKHLKSMVTRLSPTLASQVQQALEIPLQKSIKRVQARHYISIYQEDSARNESLLEFAKLDFNLVQLIHQKEISEITRWWKEMNIKSKLPFEIRDRVVEGYSMMLSVYFEPQYSIARIHLAKITGVLSVLDDAFDVYGDLEELEPLTNAFQRWDVGDNLQQHIKVIFLEVLNVVNEIEEDMIRRGHFNGLPYLKQEIKEYTKALLDETKIMYSGVVPTMEEWLPISAVTAAINIFAVDAVMNLGELATKEVFDWMASMPKIIRCSYLINRLLDDIGTYKVERERGITLSNITCYMKDHGVSESEAIENLQKKVVSLWKDMNQECLKPNHVPMQVFQIVFNLSRVMLLYYADGRDGYTNSEGRTKEVIASLLTYPVPI